LTAREPRRRPRPRLHPRQRQRQDATRRQIPHRGPHRYRHRSLRGVPMTSTDTSPRRLRVAHVIVQPVLVWDDGETLSPAAPLQPATLTLPELDGLADTIRAEVAQLEEQAPPV